MGFSRQEYWSGLGDQSHVSCMGGRVLYRWITGETLLECKEWGVVLPLGGNCRNAPRGLRKVLGIRRTWVRCCWPTSYRPLSAPGFLTSVPFITCAALEGKDHVGEGTYWCPWSLASVSILRFCKTEGTYLRVMPTPLMLLDWAEWCPQIKTTLSPSSWLGKFVQVSNLLCARQGAAVLLLLKGGLPWWLRR